MTEPENTTDNNPEGMAPQAASADPKTQTPDVEGQTVPADATDAGGETESITPEILSGETPEPSDAIEETPAAFDELELEVEEEDGLSPAGAKLEALNRELQEVRGKLEANTGQYMRITADFENFRKRTRKEQAEQEVKVKCSTILELLPVIDNFERARTQLKPEGDAALSVHKSYQGIYKQLVDCLKRIGVSPMRAEGSEFDPMLHEAVMREPTAEHPDGTVLEELQRGYMLGDRVLRHAMVRVAVAPEPAAESSEGA